MTLAPGTTLAGYRIESLLGRGGMGEVYLATHEGLGRKVALKLLAPELAADPGFQQRFIAESRLAAALDHPHIVPIYEAGDAAGRLFLAMRYVEGADLGALIARDGPLEPTRAIGLLRGIADALDAAHDRGLVHRDVKPANILVARTSRADEHAYLGDFGLTKQLGSDAGFTKSGQLVGSVDYVAPEQIEGRPIDHRVDVYSLACVLYTALAGQPPYPRETEMATLWAHVQSDPPQLSDVRPELASLDDVIARGMAKEPAERFANGRELVAAARAALAGETAAAGGEPATIPSADPPVTALHNLPAQLSSFVGRVSELHDLVRLLTDSRLVTLTGPGGTGKTRLAQQAAIDVTRRFADGIVLVELASITDPARLPSQVAAALALTDAAGQSTEETLLEALGSKRILLLLDNLEQLQASAPFVRRLLDRCPGVHVLATSRTPLHLRDEHVYPVSPLGLPHPGALQTVDGIARNEAVRLFAARAAAVRADFRVTDLNAQAVAAVCVRVDGLPLAIELAVIHE